MKNRLLIVQNIGHEGPGLLDELLIEHRIASDRIDLSSGASLPDPCHYAGMLVLGGPQSANDTSNQIQHELAVIARALDAGIPYLGICLGLQLLVRAAGGKIVRCKRKEIGFREPDGEPFMVHLTPEGRQDILFNGMPEQLRVFQLHGETVVTGPDMTLLATGRGCTNQVVRVGKSAWGIQCHFELTPDMFNNWIELDADLVKMDRRALLDDFNSFPEDYRLTGRSLLLNFLVFTGLINK